MGVPAAYGQHISDARARLDFVDAGVAERAADGDEHRAWCIRMARQAEPVWARSAR
jgi:hypothetical protein